MTRQSKRIITNPFTRPRQYSDYHPSCLRRILLLTFSFILGMGIIFFTRNNNPSLNPTTTISKKLNYPNNSVQKENNLRKPPERTKKDKPQEAISKEKNLIVKTHHGNFKIVLRPDLSPESVQYVVEAASFPCNRCNFYRAESGLLLQGVMAVEAVKKNTVLGKCPDRDHFVSGECPKHDPDCGCHGPIMTRGMVAWAAGRAGPDFFVNTHLEPVGWWEHQHTVWGEIRDDASFAVLDRILALPTHGTQLKYLDEKISFRFELENV
mmetsp:Transcript_24426/g.48648  ORF Transcript_24426/g.48648 Transcript_24426/m.48648 type:complete len:266 (-) Transcript_24426:426-1223(-)